MGDIGPVRQRYEVLPVPAPVERPDEPVRPAPREERTAARPER